MMPSYSQWLCIPFAWMNEAVETINPEEIDWIGHVPYSHYGELHARTCDD